MTVELVGFEPPELPQQRTGYVRVTFSNGTERYLGAASFAKAASQTKCGRGAIARFEWVSREVYEYHTKGSQAAQEPAGATNSHVRLHDYR